MRPSVCIEASDQAADAKRPDSAFLSVLLLGFSHKFRYVLHRRTIIVVEAIALALDASFVG